MYNLQKAKEEIDAVAKHATDVTEYVIALGETLQSLDGSLEAKLEAFKAELLAAIDAKLGEVRRTVLGSDEPMVETSFINELGSRVSRLKQRAPGPSTLEGAPAGIPAHEPSHADHHEGHGEGHHD